MAKINGKLLVGNFTGAEIICLKEGVKFRLNIDSQRGPENEVTVWSFHGSWLLAGD